MSDPITPSTTVREVEVAIAGAGFGGLCMAIQLQKNGIHDFLILEKAKEVGGAWRDNHYPGAACDVQSHMYSYSFETKADWTKLTRLGMKSSSTSWTRSRSTTCARTSTSTRKSSAPSSTKARAVG